jgi:transposase
VLFNGDDWAEAHHDVEIEDEAGRVLARRRLPEGLAGITMLHELVAEHLNPAAEPDQVLVGIETERGPWVQALLAAGHVVFAINPLRVARYRERHSPSGAKSDAADAHLLAEIVRLDRAHHRRSPATVRSLSSCLCKREHHGRHRKRRLIGLRVVGCRSYADDR